jgi:hypothetical protein
MKGDEEHFVGLAEFDFIAEAKNELTFKAGDEIKLAPKDKVQKNHFLQPFRHFVSL